MKRNKNVIKLEIFAFFYKKKMVFNIHEFFIMKLKITSIRKFLIKNRKYWIKFEHFVSFKKRNKNFIFELSVICRTETKTYLMEIFLNYSLNRQKAFCVI